jgi:hypothetical protein
MGQGLQDSDLILADAQAVPTDGGTDDSEHCVDSGLVTPWLDAGIPVELIVEVSTAIALSAGTPTLDFGIITDGTAPSTGTWDSAAIVCSGVLRLSGANAKGLIFSGYLPPRPGVAYERYIGFNMDPSTSGFSAGAVNVWLRPKI